MVLHLRDYAEMALAQSDYERALVVAGTVQAMEDESGIGMVGTSENRVEGLDQAREALGEDRAQELFDQGRDMSRARAIHYARSKPV